MNIFESFGCIMLGFAPKLCALEKAWNVGVVKSYKVRKVIEEEKVFTNVP